MDEEKKKLLLDNQEFIDNDLRIMKEVAMVREKVRERAVRYMYQIITAIGVIAGFGFTAIIFVKSINRFIVGEFLLFSAIAVGVWFVKRVFIDEVADYNNYLKSIGEVIDERGKILMNDSIEEIKRKMKEVKDKELKIFKQSQKGIKTDFVLIILCLFIVGGIVLLSSFINFY